MSIGPNGGMGLGPAIGSRGDSLRADLQSKASEKHKPLERAGRKATGLNSNNIPGTVAELLGEHRSSLELGARQNP